MLSTYLSKLLVISASTVSALGLLIAVPHAATAQMSEDMTEDSMVTESVEDESMTEDMDVTEAGETEDGLVGQTMDESEDMDAVESDSMEMEAESSDMDAVEADAMPEATTTSPAYSSSPRALW